MNCNQSSLVYRIFGENLEILDHRCLKRMHPRTLIEQRILLENKFRHLLSIVFALEVLAKLLMHPQPAFTKWRRQN